LIVGFEAMAISSRICLPVGPAGTAVAAAAASAGASGYSDIFMCVDVE